MTDNEKTTRKDPESPAPDPQRGSGRKPGGKPPGRPPQPSLHDYRKLEAALYAVRAAVDGTSSFEEFAARLAQGKYPLDRVRQLADIDGRGDLHLHSTASDGMVPPQKLPWIAKALGLKAIALTDHDSVEGCRAFFREGALLDIRAMAGIELSTEQPGLEILAYFPDAGKLFAFLATTRSTKFRAALNRRQEDIHARSLACMKHVNQWLRRQKVADESPLTEDEVDQWYGGQKPFYPGTMCVLGLKRLSPEDRQRLEISDPRAFNTKVVTPLLKKLEMTMPRPGPKSLLAENFSILKSVASAEVPVAICLPHPKELVTKGGMSLGAVQKLVFELGGQGVLDGMEVACARDTEGDIRYWREIVRAWNSEVSSGQAGKAAKTLLEASHASDFHVLAPGLATGEITMGFGLLNERPPFRRGNLRPQGPVDDFLESLTRRAVENAGL